VTGRHVFEGVAIQEPRLGDLLVESGRVTAEQVDEALAQQRREGGFLGQHLVLTGAISRRELYAALADQWDVPLRDLVTSPPDPRLSHEAGYVPTEDEGWVPCEYDDAGRLVVATHLEPDDALRACVRRWFPHAEARFVVSTSWDLFWTIEALRREELLYLAQDELSARRPEHSARAGLTRWQLLLPAVVVVVVALGALHELRETFIVALTAANLVFLVSIAFKAWASIRQPWVHARREKAQLAEMQERARRGLAPRWHERTTDADLPIYTVLVPVFRESNIIAKLISNLGSIDYPKTKLDVIVLMEANDEETVAAAKAMRPPEYVRLLVVPPGHPQTKPRACNYGLAFARGKYVVIYDAEDRPEPDQLRLALAAFERDRMERELLGSAQRPVACVQAALHYFNADYNVLTRLFAIEYAHWFTSMLPGLDGSGVPIPLGGTSNHFDTEVLRELGAWDPYNVTEDADLGLRASVQGYRVAVIGSSTGEEACAQVGAWIKQRTRWIKGYMVTGAVNTRHPVRFLRECGLMGAVGLVGLIIGTPLTFLMYPLVIAFTVATYVGVKWLGLDLPVWVVWSGLVTMLLGNSLMIVVSGLAATRRYNWRIGLFAVLNPVYWLLHSVAAWRALFQTIFSPHEWEKTPHGISEDYESTAHV
jgi:cellulose synthase/poly-beta-1,6-N-acetylglucosamine synthase-like glycosyltransferase